MIETIVALSPSTATELPSFKRRSKIYRRRSEHRQQPLAGPASTALLTTATLSVLALYNPDLPVTVGTAALTPAGPVVSGLSVDVDLDTTLADVPAQTVSSAAGAALDLDTLVAVAREAERPPYPVLVVDRDAVATAGWAETRSDVMLYVDGNVLHAEFNVNAVPAALVDAFLRHVGALVDLARSEPARILADISLVDFAEQHSTLAAHPSDELAAHPSDELVANLSDGRTPATTLGRVDQLVVSRAQHSPEAPAINDGDTTTTYAELVGQARQVAAYLQAHGGAGGAVGICLPPSTGLITTVLGVMLAGAIPVPIVPTFPQARNALVVEDAHLSHLVATPSRIEEFASLGVPVVSLSDVLDGGDVTEPGNDPTDSGQPAYVLFTSGSSGRPKGVAVLHATLANLVAWQVQRSGQHAGDKTLQRTSIGFDVSFQEIFSTLAAGGTLVVTPDEIRDDISQLAEFIEHHQINRVFLPPVALEQLAAGVAASGRTLPTLREVIVAGEQLRITMPVRRFFHSIDATLDNQYGPTETHVVTAHRLAGPSTRWADLPSIGRAVTHVDVWVLDRRGQPVPVGVPGEIHVGGVAARGRYLNPDPEASTGYIELPAGSGSERVYRTGDLARIDLDGNLEFLGRRDDQVKIRGYRIELGEIEVVLGSLPDVLACAATVQDAGVLGKQLAAFVVPATDAPFDAAQTRQALLTRLPDHMVPATGRIVELSAIPLTPTGKIARRSLPLLATSSTPSGADDVRGVTEETVAAVWKRALGLGAVARDDNFLDLGGHSLVGIQIVAELNELFEVNLPLRSLLRGGSVAQVSSEIGRQLSPAGPSDDEDAASRALAHDTGRIPDGLDDDELLHVRLPDGRDWACYQVAETQYLWLDTVEHANATGGRLSIPTVGTVIDVGAHVGLFSRLALDSSSTTQVIAVEPSPQLRRALALNIADEPRLTIVEAGLGEKAGRSEFTYYPQLTGMTTRHPDPDQERALLAGILRNLARDEGITAANALAGQQDYLSERLEARTFEAEVTTLSDLIAQLGVDKVDLLKIDAQKSELDILRGVADHDWGKIYQVSVEVHDLDDTAKTIRALLEAHGFDVAAVQDNLHRDTVVSFLYATRVPEPDER